VKGVGFQKALSCRKSIRDNGQTKEASHAVCVWRAGKDNSNDDVEVGGDLDNDKKGIRCERCDDEVRKGYTNNAGTLQAS
jgi:hypothetical protein